MAKKEKWTREVATKVTRRSIDLLSRDQKRTDPTLRITLRSPNKCRIINRQKRDEMRDKAVGIARREGTLRGVGTRGLLLPHGRFSHVGNPTR